MKILFAQGNPGDSYARTRHNVGFMVLDALAEAHNVRGWKKSSKASAEIAEITVSGEKVLLVKPTSFYNDTGLVARALIDFYKLDSHEDLLVIHDDLALPFGTIRTRGKGSDAGNNGIKSLNQHLGSEYGRIRIGIWNDLRDRVNDADFVLSRFTEAEQTVVKEKIIPLVIKITEGFVAGEFRPDSVTTLTS
ncbi:aminoacyl-tRNA hydrolase [Candidatus Saccharibacteria bacterium]|nr:aminoacyl-tRNA hydrolase [Candidatus Saccharibacteria bacterium]NCS82905.1 aminoacyl-tRNA hydrolase [Candidatus Saccharibacteria bacterium]